MIELKHNNPERNLENGSTKQPITTWDGWKWEKEGKKTKKEGK
jgi:hypothetical protein